MERKSPKINVGGEGKERQKRERRLEAEKEPLNLKKRT